MRTTLIPRSLVSLLAVTTVATSFGACGPSEGPTVRLVGSIPAERFRFSGQSLDEVFRWQFGADADLADWTLRADQTIERGDESLHLAGSDRSSLVRTVDFRARDVDRILVRISGLRIGPTRVFWTRAGEQFSPERQVVLTPSDAVDGVYEFRVGEHPDWAGRIVGFRLDATIAPSERVSVLSVVGARANADLPATIHASDWGIDVDEELRAGFVVVPGRPQIRRVAVPDRAHLYLSTALLLPPRDGSARFTIVRVDGNVEREIFARTVASPGPGQQVWGADVVELDASGDGAAELRFALDCPEDDDCAGAFASLETRAGARPARPNVVLISIDTLRADRMSLYGNGNPTTPSIDRWAGTEGITFERVVAPAPWTLPSHMSMFTGLDPTSHNLNYNSPAPEGLELLSERLHARGYFTAAITGGGYVDPSFGFRQGFDVYAYWRRDVSRYETDPAAADQELLSGLRRASVLLDEADGRPFFLFFHTYQVHAPYRPRQPYFRRFHGSAPEHPGMRIAPQGSPPPAASNGYKVTRVLRRTVPGVGSDVLSSEELPLAHAMYDSGVAHTDAGIGELFDELEARDLLRDTIIVLTSDHGEMLGEEGGLAGHAYLREANLLVPLVISWPARLDGGRRIDAQVRTVDITPTILDLLGHEVPDGLDGVSLVPWLEGGTVRNQRDGLSYAASTNRGISVRFANDLKYVYNNSLWRAGPADRLAPVDPDSPAATMDFTARAAELRRWIEQLLEARDGLHMALVNDEGNEDFTVRLRGPAVQRAKLKATRLQCACAVWLGRSTIDLRVPAGQGFAVQFEDVAPGSLSIELIDGEEPFSAEIDVDRLDEPVAVAAGAEGWHRARLRDAEIGRGLVIWWQGAGTPAGDESLDQDLRRQLRALGYLR